VKTSTPNIPGLCPGIEILKQIQPYVRHCGDERRPAWRIETRCLLDYLLVYIAEGQGRFEIAGITWDVEPNDLFWIPPGTPHAMEGHPPSMVCPYAHFDLLYRPDVSHWDFTIPSGMTDLSDFTPLMHPDMSYTSLGKLCGRIRTFTNRRVGQILREICAEAYRAQPFAFLRISGLLTTALAEILRGQAGLEGEHGRHVPALERAAEFMRDRCHEEISVEQAAETASLSESYFRQLFATHFGCPPREYLRAARINKAKRLMTDSPFVRGAGIEGMTLTEIARKCGFASVHSFSRTFKAVEGVSPSEYRSCGTATTRISSRPVQYNR
jgi:AraC-like DNA-binding protein